MEAASASRVLPTSTPLAIATGAVVATQACFVLTAYCHAALSGALAPRRFHISAVLDDDDRSMLCACVGLAGLCSLVLLETCRKLPRPRLRTCLAAACGSGIVLTCVVRESRYRNAHRGTAVLAFGAAVALVWVVSAAAREPCGRRAACRLLGLVMLTGGAQGLSILGKDTLGVEILPSWALGSLELCLCACERPLEPPQWCWDALC